MSGQATNNSRLRAPLFTLPAEIRLLRWQDKSLFSSWYASEAHSAADDNITYCISLCQLVSQSCMTKRQSGLPEGIAIKPKFERYSEHQAPDTPSFRKRGKPTFARTKGTAASSSITSTDRSATDTTPIDNDEPTKMFSSRRYQALPTSTSGGGQRRRGVSPMKKYMIIGGLSVFACVLLLGGRHVATTSPSLVTPKQGSAMAGDDGALEDIWGKFLFPLTT